MYIERHRVEPNSGPGAAIAYMTKRWDRFTLFLRQPGAPLDNNLCERALKKAILHRKNSLFYKTQNGARVGDHSIGPEPDWCKRIIGSRRRAEGPHLAICSQLL